MPTVNVSEETYAALQALARPFEDTPDTVIRRLLEQTDSDSALRSAVLAARGTVGRAAPGTILPEREYWAPILKVLVDLGGAGPAQEVIDRVGQLLSERLTPRDLEPLDTGEIRYRKRVQFARFRMKERGLLADDSDRGIWEIADEGRQYLQELERRS